MSLILFEKLPRAYDLRNLNEADSDDEDYEEEEIDDEADGLDDEADFNDPLNDDQLRAELRGMGVGSLGDEEDEESDAELDIGQFQEFRTKLDFFSACLVFLLNSESFTFELGVYWEICDPCVVV